MDELRARFERLVRLENDPIRLSEHKTFTRLLYRNRNQHRHGLYFRRLEHVRRLLRSADKHVVWESVRHAIGDKTHLRARSITKPPLSLSTVTLDDLQSIESSHHALVTTVIPKAAVKVTLELICREHFLPFAIAIIATLSRLFVIEQRVLSELRGAVIETKLLLCSDTLTANPGLPNRITDDVSEDIGEVVNIPRGINDEPIQKYVGHSSNVLVQTPNPLTSQAATSDVIGGSFKVNAHETRSKQKPSLYDLMAKHDSRAATAVASKIRLKASVSDAIDAHLDFDSSANQAASPGILRKRQPVDTESQGVLPSSTRDIAITSELTGESCKRIANPSSVMVDLGEVRKDSVKGSSSESDEEDDDLDDIFDVMGD